MRAERRGVVIAPTNSTSSWSYSSSCFSSSWLSSIKIAAAAELLPAAAELLPAAAELLAAAVCCCCWILCVSASIM